jgi:hypothetical protein
MKRLSIAALILMTVTACGPKLPPETSIEGKTAVRATQVVTALRATLPGIKALTCTPEAAATAVPTCLKAADAIKVVTQIEIAGKAAEELAGALTVVDNAKTATERQTALSRAANIMNTIQAALSMAQVAPENEPARASIVKILQTVTSALFAVLAL